MVPVSLVVNFKIHSTSLYSLNRLTWTNPKNSLIVSESESDMGELSTIWALIEKSGECSWKNRFLSSVNMPLMLIYTDQNRTWTVRRFDTNPLETIRCTIHIG